MGSSISPKFSQCEMQRIRCGDVHVMLLSTPQLLTQQDSTPETSTLSSNITRTISAPQYHNLKKQIPLNMRRHGFATLTSSPPTRKPYGQP